MTVSDPCWRAGARPRGCAFWSHSPGRWRGRYPSTAALFNPLSNPPTWSALASTRSACRRFAPPETELPRRSCPDRPVPDK